MMTDGSAIVALRESFEKPQNATVDGRDVLLVPNGWKTVAKPELRTPTTIMLTTLSALVKYLGGALDSPMLVGALVVSDPDTVELVCPMEDEEHDFRRHKPVIARRFPTEPFPFGQFMPIEAFVIMLMARFEDTPEREKFLGFVSAIEDGGTLTLADDGVSQTVTTRRGVKSTRENVTKVTLAPFRTFTDIPQIPSTFVVRMRSGADGSMLPSIALFECDGGKWKAEAVAAIGKWLTEKVPSVKVLA